MSRAINAANGAVIGMVGRVLLGQESFHISIKGSSRLVHNTHGSITRVVGKHSTLLIVGNFGASTANLGGVFTCLVNYKDDIIYGCVSGGLCAVLVDLVTRYLGFVADARLVVASFRVDQLVIVMPLSITMGVRATIFTLGTLIGQEYLRDQGAYYNGVPR